MFLFETVREVELGKGQRERETGSRLRAVSTEPAAGLQPTNSEIVT